MTYKLSSKTIKTLRIVQKRIMDPEESVGFNMNYVDTSLCIISQGPATSCDSVRCIGGWMLALIGVPRGFPNWQLCEVVRDHFEPDAPASLFMHLLLPDQMYLRTAEEAVEAINRFIATNGAESWN